MLVMLMHDATVVTGKCKKKGTKIALQYVALSVKNMPEGPNRHTVVCFRVCVKRTMCTESDGRSHGGAKLS